MNYVRDSFGKGQQLSEKPKMVIEHYSLKKLKGTAQRSIDTNSK